MDFKLKLTLQNLIVNSSDETYTINSTDDTTNKTDTSRIRSFNISQPLIIGKKYLIVYDVLSITELNTIGTYLRNSNITGGFQYSIANTKTTGKKVAIVTPTVEANQFAIYFDKSTDVEKIATFKNPAIFEYREGMEKWIDEVNSFVIPNSDILDKFEFITDMGTSDFTLGKLIVPTIKTKFHNDVEIKIGDVVTVYIDGTKYGTYEPYEIKQQNLYREVTLYSMPYFALSKTFQPSTTNYTTRSLLLEMQNAIGFKVVSFQDIVAIDMNDVKADTGINLLQAIAMLLGTNITINAHGEIMFTDITTSTVYEISPSDITAITKSDTTDYLITRIIGKLSDSDENPIIVGTNGNSWNDLTLVSPYLTESVCTSILSKLPNYTGFDLTIFNSPLLKPLDKVKFTYKNTEYTIPVMNMTITFGNSGLVARVQSCVSNANDKSSNYKGSLTTKLDVLNNVTSELNTKVEVVDGRVSSLITKTDTIEGEVTTVKDQYSSINQTIGEIDLRVGEVQTELGDKVSTNEIISSINLSNEGVKIQGDKLQLSGSTIIISDGTSMSLDEYLNSEKDSENLLLTPNFNSGSLSPNWSWSVGSFVYIDTTYKHNGNTACRLKGSGSAIVLNTSHLSINKLEKGKTYKLSVWVYCTDTSSVTGQFDLRLNGKADGSTSSVAIDKLSFNGNNLNANQWTQLSFEVTSTQDYTSPSVSIVGVSGSIDAWVTDFELVQKGELLTQEQLINIINGSGDGFYLIDGQAYINAEYIQTGTMRADLIKVQVDGTTNLMPFNYVTLDNAINTSIFSVMNVSTYDTLGMYEVPYLYCQLPIFQGGASSDVMCTAIGYSDVEIEAGKDYWFMCEYLAFWGNDTKPDDGTGTSTATSGSKNGGLQNGQNMTLFLYNGDNVSQAKNNGYYQLATVYDFNASIKIEEREGYTGVYERAWTTLTARFTATESYKGKLCINLDCSGFIYTGEGGSFYLRRLQLTDATQSNPVFIDYTKQVKEKHMELTDGTYYTNIVGVDGIQIENGKITGKYPMSYRAFEIDDDGFKCRATTGSENAFMGVNQSYYTYDGGSSGQITGYDDIYGFGCREIVSGTSEGVFVGVHHGFQKPNSTDYGRADIYTLYKDGTAFDTHDWTLLGQKIEPLGLVRRDDYSNITTQSCLCIVDSNETAGDTYNGTTVFSEAMYNANGNGQLINVNPSDNRIYLSNPKTNTYIETKGALMISDSQHGARQALVNGIQSGDIKTNIYTGSSIEIWADRDYSTTTERIWIGAGGNSIAITSSGTGQSNTNVRYNNKIMYHEGYQQTSTSDIRYKRAVSDVSTEDCYDMVKNTTLHNYLLLDDVNELHSCSEDGINELETELDADGYSRKVQMGIIAQDVLRYECGKHFVVQDIVKDDDGNITSDKYSIDAYNYASAILGGLQEEIKIRDEQYEELKKENEDLKAKNQELEERLARIEKLLLGE